MKCNVCGYINKDNAEFCMKCGQEFEVIKEKKDEKLAYIITTEVIDERCLEETKKGKLAGLVLYGDVIFNNFRYLAYDLRGSISLKQLLSKEIKKEKILKIVINMCDMLEYLQIYGVKLNVLGLKLDQIYVNNEEITEFLCFPFVNRELDNTIAGIMRELFSNVIPGKRENSEYINEILTYIYNNPDISILKMKNKIQSILDKIEEEYLKMRQNIEKEEQKECIQSEYEVENNIDDNEDEEDEEATSMLDVGEKKVIPKLISESKNIEINITKESFVIGKSKKCDYTLVGNNTVSRQHVMFICKKGQWYIKDLNSSNGTYVNNERLEPDKEQMLMQEDAIRISNEEFKFSII